jgi:hypothetical protein
MRTRWTVWASVGVVFTAQDGSLLKAIGKYVVEAGEFAVIAVPAIPGICDATLEDSEKLKYGLVKTRQDNLSGLLTSFGDAVKFPRDLKIRSVLAAYYNGPEPSVVVSDSMLSAASAAGRTECEALGRELAMWKRKAQEAALVAAESPPPRWKNDEGDVAAPRVEKRNRKLSSAPAFSSFHDDEADEDEEDEDEPGPHYSREFEQLRARSNGLWSGGAASSGLPRGEDDGNYARLTQRFRQGRPGVRRPDAQLHPRQAAAAPPAPAANSENQLMHFAVLKMLEKMADKDGFEEGGATGGGKAFQRVHALQGRVMKEPKKVVSEYLADTMDKLGAEEDDAWQLHQLSGKLNWGKMKGLHRVHFHVSHALTMSLRGEHDRCEAYLCQLLRGLHQVSLDNGSWDTAALLLPKKDPLHRELFGGTERELEAAVAYQEALRKIKKGISLAQDADEEKKPVNNKKGGGKGGGADQ